jgi:hypothetical protein
MKKLLLIIAAIPLACSHAVNFKAEKLDRLIANDFAVAAKQYDKLL